MVIFSLLNHLWIFHGYYWGAFTMILEKVAQLWSVMEHILQIAASTFPKKEVQINMAKTNRTTDSAVEIRNYPTALIHKHNSEDGEYASFSFRWKDKWTSCFLPSGALSPSTTRKGKAIEGRMNISLGDPD